MINNPFVTYIQRDEEKYGREFFFSVNYQFFIQPFFIGLKKHSEQSGFCSDIRSFFFTSKIICLMQNIITIIHSKISIYIKTGLKFYSEIGFQFWCFNLSNAKIQFQQLG